jgi:hypothetical protein
MEERENFSQFGLEVLVSLMRSDRQRKYRKIICSSFLFVSNKLLVPSRKNFYFSFGGRLTNIVWGNSCC